MTPHRSRVENREAGAGEVAGYIRVSSTSQDYADQRSSIEAAARARGELVGRWYADIASGKTLDRPELQRMRAELQGGAVRRVWVWRLDRLSRSGIASTFECVAAIRGSGAELLSVTEGFAFERGPAGDIMLAILAWSAEQERLKIRENQEAARQRMALQGRPWGRPPLAPHLEDAIPALRSQGKTIRQIARELQISRSVVGKRLASKTREI
jgi:DNA invertase Pin-like site-specific DNA recombinase